MKNRGFKYGVKPRGPLSKRKLLSENRSFKNACEKRDQLKSSTIPQGNSGCKTRYDPLYPYDSD